jgi:SAM-dependent methyltransferase
MSADGEVRNPFDSDPAARRYATARPYYHRSALDLAMEQQQIGPARLAVDVGCGTGLSARAVSDLADRVIAIDASAAMLRAAQGHANIRYLVVGAEQIPLGDKTADLATVGGAFHWFDQGSALGELARILREDALLVVYSDFFLGQLTGQPAFATWLIESYLPRYPSPIRHAQFDPEAAVRAGFGRVSFCESEYEIPFTGAEMADYLLSQSNAGAVIGSGAISAEALRDQIIGETAAFFRPGVRATFGVRVWTAVRQPRPQAGGHSFATRVSTS